MVVLGPRIGEDACAIEIEAGTLIAATDPITLTGAGVGAHAVAVNANDVAVTGARPRWFLACVLLPEGSTPEDAEALFEGMRRALDQVGAALVGGHTEVTSAVRQPLVVGQMLGIATERIVPTGGLRPGHAVVQIGPAPGRGRGRCSPRFFRQSVFPGFRLVCWRRLDPLSDTPGILVVEPALAAARAGASALHDPTEGGLSAGCTRWLTLPEWHSPSSPNGFLWYEPGVELVRRGRSGPLGNPRLGDAASRGSPPTGSTLRCRTLRATATPRPSSGGRGGGRGVAFTDGAPLTPLRTRRAQPFVARIRRSVE